MKVLLIDVNCKYSSTGKIVYDLYSELNAKGHTAAICYGRGPLVEGENIYKFSSNIEVYFHAFLTRITGLTGCYSFFATRNLINYLIKFKPDIVHINELHGYFVNISPVINYLKYHNIKTIWTFHCEFMYTGKCGHAYECDKWQDECGRCPQIKAYPSSLFFDFTKKMFKEKKKIFENFNNLYIVTPSKWLANRVKKSFLKNKSICVINNGIDNTKVFYRREFSHLTQKHNINNKKVVLAVAPNLLDDSKGGMWVLNLANKFNDEKTVFILIGINKKNHKVNSNIILIEKTYNQNTLAEYYSMADVFVICSKRENFPTTCLESLSCGTPVVGFDSGGTRETAPNGLGAFVKYGDIELLEDKVRYFLNNKNSDKIKRECIQYAKKIYSKETMVNNYFKLYKSEDLQ